MCGEMVTKSMSGAGIDRNGVVAANLDHQGGASMRPLEGWFLLQSGAARTMENREQSLD